MPLYRMANPTHHLEIFRPTDFGSHYMESHLEDWLEENPEVLVADEPLLVIGRQVSTPVGIIDLLALDAEGALVVAELKRAPDQRGAIAQVLEYAAWFSAQNANDICVLAEKYLQKRTPVTTLEMAWQDTYNSQLTTAALNRTQRIFIVMEGLNERLISVAQYLRRARLDITLLSYNYYRTANHEELLQLDTLVGGEESNADGNRQTTQLLTDQQLLDSWSENVVQAYEVFKEKMTQHGLITEVKRSQISFRKPTNDGRIFICGYHGAGDHFRLWLRSDSLQSRFDFHAATQRIEERTQPAKTPKLTDTWYLLDFVATVEKAALVADVIIREVAAQINEV